MLYQHSVPKKLSESIFYPLTGAAGSIRLPSLPV
jgi:hypothetical protein